MESAGGTGGSALKRLVIVADNSLIVEAIRVGLRNAGTLNLLGYADIRKTTARAIAEAGPDAVLVDDMNQSEQAVRLITQIKAEDPRIAVIVLSLQMDSKWLERVFDAGAAGAISKATHPVALATLLRETLNGHVFHRFSPPSASNSQLPAVVAPNDLPLTAREVEILQLVAAGSANGEVARRLWVTEQTVKFHLRNIYRKLDVANRTEASHFAHINGLVNGGPAVAAKAELPVAS
jgi:DNA-binding NarL/FixJ family response regulator